jgi:membrane protease YdiL (CAAX protease family)
MEKFLYRYRYLSIHIILLFIVHSFYVYVYTQSPALRNNYSAQIALRLITWTVPVLIYLSALKINLLDYLKLRKNVFRGIICGLIIGSFILILHGTGYYFKNNAIKINFQFGMGIWFKSIILVGFSEEILFRGFILKKLQENTNFSKANIIQSILFVLIHCVGWIQLGQFVFPSIVQNCGFIFIVAIIMGYIYKKTDSLWSCILVHSFLNFASLSMVLR